ncbi:unnamed protein product [Rotaria magnacalcarata]
MKSIYTNRGLFLFPNKKLLFAYSSDDWEEIFLINQIKCLSDMSHTILLLQSTNKLDSRTYSDYESVDECLDGVCKVFEEHLKKRNPTSPSITYDISELFEFVDQISDLSCLVFQKQTGQYEPHNKEWIKQQIFQLLRKQAAGGK